MGGAANNIVAALPSRNESGLVNQGLKVLIEVRDDPSPFFTSILASTRKVPVAVLELEKALLILVLFEAYGEIHVGRRRN